MSGPLGVLSFGRECGDKTPRGNKPAGPCARLLAPGASAERWDMA